MAPYRHREPGNKTPLGWVGKRFLGRSEVKRVSPLSPSSCHCWGGLLALDLEPESPISREDQGLSPDRCPLKARPPQHGLLGCKHSKPRLCCLQHHGCVPGIVVHAPSCTEPFLFLSFPFPAATLEQGSCGGRWHCVRAIKWESVCHTEVPLPNPWVDRAEGAVLILKS